MSVRYVCGDEMIWSPADHSNAVFRALVELYERRHDLASGVVWPEKTPDGVARVDATELSVFAQAVVDEWESVGSTVFHQLADGFVAALQVIAERCAIELDVSDTAYALAAAARHNM